MIPWTVTSIKQSNESLSRYLTHNNFSSVRKILTMQTNNRM